MGIIRVVMGSRAELSAFIRDDGVEPALAEWTAAIPGAADRIEGLVRRAALLGLGGHPFALYVDPVDGSSNADVNGRLGSIFSVRLARAIRDGGGFGSIIGRHSFRRPRVEALRLLARVMAVYAGA